MHDGLGNKFYALVLEGKMFSSLGVHYLIYYFHTPVVQLEIKSNVCQCSAKRLLVLLLGISQKQWNDKQRINLLKFQSIVGPNLANTISLSTWFLHEVNN